jgi:TolB-like protein/Flp pilus assembly protein TadD
MDTPTNTSGTWRFGVFEFDAHSMELRRIGIPVKLRDQSSRILMYLLQHAGRMVTREELRQFLWPSDTFVDFDHSLNTAVMKLREVLGDSAEKPHYIETIPKRGYRFVAPVSLELARESRTSTVDPEERQAKRTHIMLAVLPFENLSGDPGQEYFSDGLTEEIIMRLGQLSPRQMAVIARTSSMTYKGTDKTIARIGEELGIEYVLEGSVRRDNERVRITAQLVRVQDQIHLWAQSYDSKLPGILDIHGEIGAAITAQVKLALTSNEARRLTKKGQQDAEAYDYYLRGRFHYARITFPELQKAISYFRKATERDPEYALAYSGLADSLMILPITSDVPSRDAFPEAKGAIVRALESDPDSAETHNSDSTAKFWFDWDYAGAEAAARRAISLNPSYSLAHLYLAHILSNIGRHDEALSVIQSACVLDPYSLITNTMYGQFLYQAGQDSQAVAQFNSTLDLEPNFWVAHICLAKVYERLGRYSEAIAACENAWIFSGGNTEALSIASYVHAVAGKKREAEAKFQQMLEQRKQRFVPPYNLALALAGMGETESTLHWLGQALDDRDVHMTFLLDHKWDRMRRNAHFQGIVQRVGLGGLKPSTS